MNEANRPSNLVVRLRAVTANSLICREAADEIETLWGDVDHSIENGKKLRAEIERLRAALTRIEAFPFSDDSRANNGNPYACWRNMALIARETLKYRPADETTGRT